MSMRQSVCSHESWLLRVLSPSITSLWPQGFNRDHLSTRISLKHILLRKGSLPVISLMYHCCPDLILFCSALATQAYFSLLKKCYSFIIKDEAAPAEGTGRFVASTLGLWSEDTTSVIWSYWASMFWLGNPGYLYLPCLFHSAVGRLNVRLGEKVLCRQ